VSDETSPRRIMDTAFAEALRRQFESLASGAAPERLRLRAHVHKRGWLLVAAVVTVACAAIVAAVLLSSNPSGSEGRSGVSAHSSGASSLYGAASRGESQGAFGRPITLGPAPEAYGDELSEFTPGADGHIWAWGATHGTDKQHPGGPLLESWGGQQWSRVAAPGNDVYGVAEPAPNDLWLAVTKRQGGRLAHWDGSRWRLYPSMSFTGTSDPNNVLLAFSPRNVWAVGNAGLDPRELATHADRGPRWRQYHPTALSHLTALHWDGSRWLSVPMPSLGRGAGDAYLDLITGSSPDSIWALGYYTQYRWRPVAGGHRWVGSGGGELLLHWDGRRWSRQALPATQLATSGRDRLGIDDMAAAPDGTLWCEGRRFFGPDNHGGLFVPVVLRLMDGHWQVMASSADASLPSAWRQFNPSSISLTSADDVWVSGRMGSSGAPSTLWRWDGNSWSVTGLATAQLPGKSFVSRVLALAPGDVWTLCNGSTTLKEDLERLQPSFLHFDGTAWRPIAAASPNAEAEP
jgi:hypothetical protein